MDKRDSCVTFKLKSELSGYEYRCFIEKLLFDFLMWVDPQLDKHLAERMAYDGRWNEEYGLDYFQINGEYIGHLKLYLYDEDQPAYMDESSRTIVFRDHYSESDVEKIYSVADKFEEFLERENIEYARRNRMRQ
jgi:hypothetical protein